MGSDIQLKFYRRCDELARRAFALIRQWEQRLTVNAAPAAGAAGELAAVNAAAGIKPVPVSPAVFALLARARAASLAGGCFNFAIGPVVKAWDIGFAQARRPAAAELAALLPLADPRAVRLCPADCAVFLPRRGMALDLGAIAKGFIADEVKAFLRRNGADSALINLGGNIHSIGAPPPPAAGAAGGNGAAGAAPLWALGLQKPFAAKGELAGIIGLADKSLVSSGIYERFFIAENNRRIEVNAAEAEQAALLAGRAENGRAGAGGAAAGGKSDYAAAAAGRQFYHHIFDPRSGLPLDNDLLGVSIIAANSVDGEIWSSLLYGMGAKAGMAFMAATGRARRAAAEAAAGADKAAAAPILAGENAAPALPDQSGQAAGRRGLLPPPDLTAIFITKKRQIFLPRRRNFRFTLTASDYQLRFYEA